MVPITSVLLQPRLFLSRYNLSVLLGSSAGSPSSPEEHNHMQMLFIHWANDFCNHIFPINPALCPIRKVRVVICDCERCLGTFWKVNPESWRGVSFGNCILGACSSSLLTNSWWIPPQMWLGASPRFQEAVKSKNKLHNEHRNYKPYFPHGSVPTGILMFFFSSHNPFTISGFSRNHRRKSLPHFLFEMLVRNPEGIQMAHESSFPSAYSSSLGVFSYFPFKTFQALAESKAPQPHGWQCQILTNWSVRGAKCVLE